MTYLSHDGLMTPEDLYYLLGGPEGGTIRLLDATYAVAGGQMSPFHAFLAERIEGAQFFDIDTVADQNASLPHMAPTPDYFADCVSSMGISSGDHVVIYDQSGAYMAASRAWWLFRLFGHTRVYVLDGGLQAWKARGFSTVSGPVEAPTASGDFVPTPQMHLVQDKGGILKSLEDDNLCCLDARPAMRFSGVMPEPRPGMQAGHIPSSRNLPFGDLLEGACKTFKNADDLRRIFTSLGLSQDSPLVVTCGSGVTACTVALGFFRAFGRVPAIYDGSWSEWGATGAGMPIEKSA